MEILFQYYIHHTFKYLLILLPFTSRRSLNTEALLGHFLSTNNEFYPYYY